MKKLLLCLFLVTGLLACKREKVMHTASGMKYVLHKEHAKDKEGKKPQVGDYITIEMVYKNDKDSVLYDSRKDGRPLRMELRKSPFAGSFEEGMTYLYPGDSATFYVSSDSLFEKVINADLDFSKGQAPLRNPSPGKYFKFNISLIKVQPYQEAEMEMAMRESRYEAAERDSLNKYLHDKNITVEPDSAGFYVMIDSAGKGPAIMNGAVVQLNFTGRFLNGFSFDSNMKTGRPYSFTVGNKEVIEGWDLAFLKLHEGDKATIILPSRLAYGSEGIKRPNSGNYYIVPPYAPLVFEVEILKVDQPAAKK